MSRLTRPWLLSVYLVSWGELSVQDADAAGRTAGLPTLEAALNDCLVALNMCETREAELPGDGQGAGVALAYEDCGDGTVVDLNTGLMWEKKLAGEMGGETCLSELHAVDSSCTWFDAGMWIEAVNAEGYAGYQDWRVPHVKELLSIVNYSRTFPSIDPVFGLVGGTVFPDHHPYWSLTSLSLSPQTEAGIAWISFFTTGGAGVFSKSRDDVLVRAVRDGMCSEPDAIDVLLEEAPAVGRRGGVPALEAALDDCVVALEVCEAVEVGIPGDGQGAGVALAYEDCGDGTVVDLNTGLMWERKALGGAGNESCLTDLHGVNSLCTQPEAETWIHAVNAEGYGGYSDWRLPHVKELQSIVDYSRTFPSIDPVFGVTGGLEPQVPYWSSTLALLPSPATFGWGIFFTKGGVGASRTEEARLVRALRNGVCAGE